MTQTPYQKEKNCPHCSSTDLKKDGTRTTTMGKKQKWFCNACQRRFILEPVSNIKGDVETVTLAMDLYMKGMSYRAIQDTLRQFKNLDVNTTLLVEETLVGFS